MAVYASGFDLGDEVWRIDWAWDHSVEPKALTATLVQDEVLEVTISDRRGRRVLYGYRLMGTGYQNNGPHGTGALGRIYLDGTDNRVHATMTEAAEYAAGRNAVTFA